MSRALALLAAIVSAAAASLTQAAPVPVPAPPAIEARTYMLVDHLTGRVLAQSGADDRVEPASITKVMTTYIAFDASLRARDPAWGIRRLADVIALAADHGLTLAQRVEMPANNLSLVFRKG